MPQVRAEATPRLLPSSTTAVLPRSRLRIIRVSARLGDAAAQRAHRDHTYDLRVTAILEKLS